MAKRWNEEDDDLDLDLEFDRIEYMKKEINKGKSTLIAVGIAPIFGLVSMAIFMLTLNALISLIMGMLGLIFLKPIYDILNIDIDKIGKKGWVKNGGVYFFTLLAVWIILMNPPFANFAGPQIHGAEIEILHEGEWVPQEEVNVTDGETVEIRVIAEITDNVAVDEESVEINFDDRGWRDMSKNESRDHIYEFEPLEEFGEFGPGDYEVGIRAEDVDGNRNSVEMVLTLEEHEE